MTAAEREALRRAIDARVRERLAASGDDVKRCRECGGELEHRTLGCRECGERERSRTYRKNRTPEQRRRDLEKDAAYRARYRLKKRARERGIV